MVQCDECETSATSNDDFFYYASYSDGGLDDSSRIDEIICQSCLNSWITSKTWGKINLIKRIKNPTGSGD